MISELRICDELIERVVSDFLLEYANYISWNKYNFGLGNLKIEIYPKNLLSSNLSISFYIDKDKLVGVSFEAGKIICYQGDYLPYPEIDFCFVSDLLQSVKDGRVFSDRMYFNFFNKSVYLGARERLLFYKFREYLEYKPNWIGYFVNYNHIQVCNYEPWC